MTANTSSCALRAARTSVPSATVRASVLGAAALFCSPAFATPDAETPDQSTIIVTGQRPDTDPYSDPDAPYKVDKSASSKLSQPIKDTPRSITAIPREVIEDIGALSVRDLVRTQPGITLGTGEGGNAFGDRVFIRGFEARNDVYIDGQRDPGVVSREIFAVEQIEILKGPSSTIGGRGTTGGAVSLVSKSPSETSFLKMEATVGTDETKRVTLDTNHRLAQDITLRINGLYHDSEVARRSRVYNDRWGAAAALLFEPTETLDIKLDYYHLTTKGMPDWGIPFDSRTQQPLAGIAGNFYGLIKRDFAETTADIATGKITADLNDSMTLNSQTRWGRTRNSYIASAPEAPNITNANPALWTVRANPKNRNAVANYVAHMTDVTARFATGGINHTLVAGIELSRETITNRPYAFAQSETVGAPVVPAIPITHFIFSPDPDQAWPLARTLAGSSVRNVVNSQAVYLLDTMALSDKLDLTLGARFDAYDLNVVSISTTGVATTLINTSEFVNWNAGLSWKPTKALTLYAAASTSSNPSGEQIDGNGVAYGGLATATASLDPERNYSYEAGVKWSPGAGDLLLTAAVFRIDKTNARVNDPVTGGVQILAGKQRSQGFELGVSGNITEHWAVFGGYTYLDAKVTASTTPAEVGARFPNIPRNSFSLLSTFELFEGLELGGQAFYADTRYGGSNVAGTASLPPYWRFDATGRYRVSPRLEFRVNVLNLTNKVYYDAIYRSGTPFAYVAPGRSALFTASVTF